MEELGVKALSILVDNLQKGAELMPAYVQDLVERYVQYKVYGLSFGIGICVIALIICLTAAITGAKEDEEGKMVLGWCGVLLILFVIGLLVPSLFQIHFVPELYMIDDLMSYGCHGK